MPDDVITDDMISAAVSTTLLTAVAKPKSVSGAAGTVEQYSLSELLAARRAIQSSAASSGPRRGVRFSKQIPPGAF